MRGLTKNLKTTAYYYSVVKTKSLNILRTFFSIWVFSHKHSRFTGQQEKGKAAGLEPETFGFRAQVAKN